MLTRRTRWQVNPLLGAGRSGVQGSGLAIMATAETADYTHDPTRWGSAAMAAHFNWLLHALRRVTPMRSRWRGVTFETIRRTFVKIAVRVEELKGRVKLGFPASYPQAAMLVMGAITTRGP